VKRGANTRAATVHRHADDMALAAKCCARDEQAWRTLISWIKPCCYGIAVRYKYQHSTDELFSDLLCRLMGTGEGADGALAAYDGTARLHTYIAVIFTRMLIDRARRARDAALQPAGAVAVENLPSPSVSPREELERAEQAAQINQALAVLSTQQRRLLEWYHHKRLSLRDIAVLTGMSKSAVARMLDRIHAILRQHLAGAID